MYRLTLLLFSLTYVLGPAKGVPQSRHHGNKIVGGEEAKDGEFPYIVSLHWDWGTRDHICGASVLTSQWLLTSATCCQRGPYYAYAGSNNNHENGTRYETDEVKYIIHEDYVPEMFSWPNDICVVKLKQKMKLNDKVKQIVIPYQGKPTTKGEETTLYGWGYANENNHTASEKLHVGRNYYVLSNDECGEISQVDMIEGYVCVLPKKGQGACGDFGSPLVISENIQVGIDSWGTTPCGGGDFPEFFTRISHYTDWIIQKLGNDSKELQIAQKS